MRWLRDILARGRRHRELAESIREHLEERIADLRDDGLTAEEAKRIARLEFGNVAAIEERSREVWQWARFESIVADVKLAFRQLCKTPGFSLTAVIVLALGIGASVSIFMFVNAALLKPLPYQDSNRLVAVFEKTVSCPECSLSYLDYLDWKSGISAFRSFEIWQADAYLLRSAGGVESLRVGRVSGGFFETLGVQPLLGRLFVSSDDAANSARTVVLPYATWQRFFGGRKEIVGEAITLDNNPYTVIGVLPREFQFAPRAAELWVTIHDLGSCERDRSCRPFYGLARLNDGITLAGALANMDAIATQLEKRYPQSNAGERALVEPLRQSIVGDMRPLLVVLLVGAVLLLVIAWVNVASLALVRAERRRREMAVRGALGASFGRLMQGLFVESAVLVGVSGLLGITASWGAADIASSFIPERVMRGMPYFKVIDFDVRVALFAGAVVLASWVVCVATPMSRVWTMDMRAGMTSGTRSSSSVWRRFGSNLVVVELAFAIVLLVSAGLLGKSFYRILHVDLNFNPEGLATLEIDANTGYESASRQLALSHRLVETVEEIPGVERASAVSRLPVTCNCDASAYRVLGGPWMGEEQQAVSSKVSSGYFATIQARLLRGRVFTETDDASHPAVAVINRSMAEQFFRGRDPVGQTIGDKLLSPASLRTVIGVVDDIREGALNDYIRPAVYLPLNQNPGNYFFLVARTGENPANVLPTIAPAIHRLDSGIGVRNEFTMMEHIRDGQASYLRSSATMLVGLFAGCALLLGVVGLYGVIAYSVSQRTQEIGVRMALGAERSSIRRLILGEATFLVVLGLVFGIGGSFIAGRFLTALLFGVHSWDLPVFSAITVTLGTSALIAAWIPAQRAADLDPMEALRTD